MISPVAREGSDQSHRKEKDQYATSARQKSYRERNLRDMSRTSREILLMPNSLSSAFIMGKYK
jgi:hypothetical protein